MAKTACEEIAILPGKDGKYPMFYVHSEVGLGKTHLLHAIANELTLKKPDFKIIAVTSKHLMDDLITLVQRNQFNQFVKKYTENIDVLLIDDIEDIKDKLGTQEQILHIFNELENLGKQIVFTADKRPREIIGLSERLRSRLESGLVVDMQEPDLETAVKIVKNMCLLLNLEMREELYPFIVEGCELNPRSLESYLTRIKATSEILKRKVDKEFLSEQMVLF